jgi:hypothetical protein
MARAFLIATALLVATPPPPVELLVRNARIVHGDGRVTPRGTVAVRHGRIVAITAGDVRGGTAVAREIDGTGRTLIPGLIDAHVHVADWALPLFLRYGVTTVRDLHNTPSYILSLSQHPSPSQPTVLAAGAALDGPGSSWAGAWIVSSVADARAAVREQVSAGVDVISVRSRLGPVMVDAIVREASARGVPVAADLGKTSASAAARSGVASIELLSGIVEAADDAERLQDAAEDRMRTWAESAREWARVDPRSLGTVARTLRAEHVAIVPALAVREVFAQLGDAALRRETALAGIPANVVAGEWERFAADTRAWWSGEIGRRFEQALPTLQNFVASYARMGGRVVAGTDAGQPFVVPGASLHRELQLYVAAGLTPAAALRTATVDAAALAGVADRTGLIDVGKDADLVLLDGDPLADITATMRIRAVVHAGTVVYER